MDRSFQHYKKHLSSNYMNMLNLNQIDEELISEENMGSLYSRRRSKTSTSVILKNKIDQKTNNGDSNKEINRGESLLDRSPSPKSKFKEFYVDNERLDKK